MRRASMLQSSTTHRQTRGYPNSMAYAAVDPPRSRASTTMSWVPDQTTSPPPYEFHDAYPVIHPASPFVGDARTLLSPKVQDGVGDFSRNHAASLSRRTPQNLSIPHLREALHSLESKMASLLSERDMLESRLEQAVRLQSPVHRLPNELLASIFVIGVLDREEDSLTLSTVMLVCRYWREVAVNTPLLWSRIVTGTHHSIERARLKLERSKSVPLHICVDFSPRQEYGSVTTESLVYAMDLLRPSIWRWKVFHLTVPNRPQAHAALTRCKECAPLLEVFSVRICHSMQEDHYSSPPLPLFGGRTPRLHSCSFTSFNFGWDSSLISRLRVLKLGGYWNGYSPSVDVILGILRACPQLEELALRNMSDVDPDMLALDSSEHDGLARIGDTRTVQLPRLVKASFYYCGNVRTRAILGSMAFPAMEKIELCFLDNVSPVLEHLRRQSLTSLPLRQMRIESSFFNELKLVRLLRRLPALWSLELVDVEDASSHLMKNLSTPPSSQTWICPKLTNLGLEGCTSLDWESLRSFVESRLPAHSRAFPRQLITTSSPITSSSSALTRPSSKITSSASEFAAHAHILSRVPVTPQTNSPLVSLGWPLRLHSINLSRCHQISKEMVQWLRMYVADVKCETIKGVWGEATII
ncbi:hypothetical protein AcV5_007739 [Taiwanofungus camphoratus]|nr:hypothetical protein AcV5_007739 [Antrodia cinnamomea]